MTLSGLLAATACGAGPDTAVVVNVVDGDTVDLDTGERVRYLMIDTPENTSEVECYGPEAAAFNVDLVEGAEVELRYDEERTDRFGRVLAYVSVDGREVNALLVERGFACMLYIPPNGADRADEFESLEAVARAQARGLWGACPEVPCN